MSTLKLLKKSKNRLKFLTEDIDVINAIVFEFQVANPASRFSPYAPPTLSPISATGTFKAGLAVEIITFVKRRFPHCQIDTTEVDDIISPISITGDLIDIPNSDRFEDRDYQEDAVRLALAHGRGTFEMATSAGKSLIIAKVILNLWHYLQNKTTTLILVPTIQLVKQFQKDLIDYGIDSDDISPFSKFAPDKPTGSIIIANRQWLERHGNELPKDIGITIVDECHMLKKGNKCCAIVEKMPLIRFGFSGTLPSEKIDKWNCIGLCGPILKTTKAKVLQKRGYIANIDIKAICLNHRAFQPMPPREEIEAIKEKFPEEWPLVIAKTKFPLEWKFIEASYEANRFIVKLATHLVGNNIVLFDHTAHGRCMEALALARESGKQVLFINGKIPLDDREDIRELMELNDNCLLFANTKAFGTGVNIKNINNIILGFSSGNSAPKVIQGIGRGLRKSERKSKMTLYDIYHKFHYSMRHYIERKRLYKENYSIQSFGMVEFKL